MYKNAIAKVVKYTLKVGLVKGKCTMKTMTRFNMTFWVPFSNELVNTVGIRRLFHLKHPATT